MVASMDMSVRITKRGPHYGQKIVESRVKRMVPDITSERE
jgi:hypothetical protein